ncbi:hypothetical protein EUTSA_v10015806mg [Eutrema salsugineum]|uniref:Protein BREAKING OF ASYMMETRY IN THE STOMATAL LINEAGE n=1 Tax=Eutrema salsugineum TaxID=72664 RepID=V4LIT9_EUTSA|nr:protein BREAKING OF ASYMMETRY IN THE STOMATAL LINEAGE [Eutrema salsugineum]ESQ43629.1 hypothetical protein EUTSA_v10015806mg [Eutrema salsugineum]
MASHWTIPKLVTWRVKDWASCFLASKISLDVDEDGVKNDGNSSNYNNLMFKRTKKKMKSKKKRSERKLSSSVSPTLTSKPPVLDEAGFIDLCFHREDGGFDVVKDEKKEVELSPEKSLVNHKLIYGDQGIGNTNKKNSLKIKGPEQDPDDKTTCQETEDVSCDAHEKNEEEEEEEMGAFDESSESNHSDEARGSFAFPILGVEWIGSPVHMPKSDDLSPKKQKPIDFGFECCRF